MLLDLGNTLVAYYSSAEAPAVLAECLAAVARELPGVDPARLVELFERERREAEDHRVRPLWTRLAGAYAAGGVTLPAAARSAAERAFLGPIFARSRLYDDALPALRALRDRGYVTAVVSNTPWGAPGELWRREVDRHGLRPYLDHEIFCADVGWRKPARPIFDRALGLCGVSAEAAVFVGDDPRWDVDGPVAIGMEAVLIDRAGRYAGAHVPVVPDLATAVSWLDANRPAPPDRRKP